MFTFHTLAFALWITAAHSCFVPRDGTSQKDITFVLIVNQKVLAVIQSFAHVLFCEVLGNPSCTNLQKPSPFWMIS
jgi:hypothetical protein